MSLKVRNWDKWQNYRKDRGQPPWIKIHRSLMRDVNWVALTDSQRGQLVGIWMLAADKDGEIPSDPKILKKICFLETEPDLKMLVELGFLEGRRRIDNHMPTKKPKSDCLEERRGETEERQSRDREEENCAEASPMTPHAPEAFLSFPVIGSSVLWPLSKDKVSEWRETYPGIDAEFQCRKALQWCRDNPKKRKTANGMLKFLNGWMERAQNDGGKNGHAATHGGSGGSNRAGDGERKSDFEGIGTVIEVR